MRNLFLITVLPVLSLTACVDDINDRMDNEYVGVEMAEEEVIEGDYRAQKVETDNVTAEQRERLTDEPKAFARAEADVRDGDYRTQTTEATAAEVDLAEEMILHELDGPERRFAVAANETIDDLHRY